LIKLYGNAKLIKGFRIDVDDGRSHAVCLDLSRDDDGTDMGPSALELCVMSHAGCYATIFVWTAKRMRIILKGLTVKVEAVKTDEAGTITEEAFDIFIKADAPSDRIQRLHEVTLKNCPVGFIFEKANVKLSYSLRVLKE